ncbi:hypothetical protein [Piscirickettsia salmonis]|uniref:Y-family DNA polymerase n=1 Tax=Piscirickettsia salmonis TaxID=1238 RepID=UPI00094B44EF|nr:hypothetical protein X973_08735 [Piscirickettsia salmonis]QHS33257.1 hypothetical protein GW535_12905 [Piscirickettsia salmonis]QIX54761.1 hypothetical protein GW536_03880 [Piscirickettsia salmonis]QNR81164.1 hypothetical protein ICC15_04055 [Piscirickettsia salmonis]WGZ70230.1 hypothetical protein E3220_00075 [Piscirickettsia salmonis EM-90]
MVLLNNIIEIFDLDNVYHHSGNTIINSCYIARDNYGIQTGMKLRDAFKICPQLIQRASRPNRYTDISGILPIG